MVMAYRFSCPSEALPSRTPSAAPIVHPFGERRPHPRLPRSRGTIAARTAIRANVPYVLEPCGMHRARLRSVAAKRAFDGVIGRRIVDQAACVMATSELERGELVEDGVPEELIRVRMNGLTIPPGGLPRRGSIRARFGISMAVPLVLALGRIARKKGLRRRRSSVIRSVTRACAHRGS